MNYETMTVESLADDCFKRSGYAINKQDLISRINHLVEKAQTEQLIIGSVVKRFLNKEAEILGIEKDRIIVMVDEDTLEIYENIGLGGVSLDHKKDIKVNK